MTSREIILLAGAFCLTIAGGSVTAADRTFLQPPVKIPALEKPGMADEEIYVNFDQADIRIMLKTIGDITGINFVVDDSVTGNVTVMSPTRIRLSRIYGVLESVLDVKGYAAVPDGTGNLVKIVPKEDAIKRNLKVRIGADPADVPQNDTLVTQIIPLSHAEAREVEQIVKPLLNTSLPVSTYPRTNSILITDTNSNIRHILEIISNLDVPGPKEEVRVIGLKYASAEVLSEQIARIMEEGNDTPSPPRRTGAISTIQTGRKIMPDTRTNSIIAVANPADTEIIEALALQLDVQRPRGANNMHVVYLENASAEETAESLTAALANLRITGVDDVNQQPVQVTADVGTNSLIITASAQDFEVISEIIEKLDVVREQVLVEMLIMEISEDSLKEIGVDWATLDEAVAGSVRGFAATNFGPRVDFVSGDYEGLAVGGWRADGDEVGIGAILSALEKVSGVNILSTPHIMTSNHNPATILVGENRAFVGQSRITDTDPATPTVIRTFEYRDVGISLQITPHISQGGLVKLEISSEFSKVIEDVTSVSADTPTTSQRQATTTITMKDGSTVVIGGLIRDDTTTSEKKIPLVGDIPVVGNLFKFQRERLEKTNLLMFITPRVVSNEQEMEEITEYKKNEMRSANGGILEEEDKGPGN